MAGHSKWANIKRQKARVDAVKGKVFARISREIIVAARSGVPDPAGNFQLRTAIEKAKAASIPNENIERAIAKGAGLAGGSSELEAIRYEGYGVGGVAILIEALTDNRNRAAADLREAFSIDHKGVCTVRGPIDEEQLFEASLEAEAESYDLISIDEDTEGAEVFTSVPNLEKLADVLKQTGFAVLQSETRWIPSNTVEIDTPEKARSFLKLMDALEDLDDVQSVTANFEMTDELMSSIMI
ncbi:MAG: YebC/PmpR family DNA-binding transcriptional regulator [Oscillatoriales cyanobacterium]|nr:MAG: YebC/PmpR family DNA-binding transcriptional regulator [Oscillatoriales cyanobacterium]